MPTNDILYYNAHSLVPILDELVLLVDTHNPDMVCIAETWLSDDIRDTEIDIPGFQVLQYRVARNRHGGGYIKSHLSVKVLPTTLSNFNTVTQNQHIHFASSSSPLDISQFYSN